MWNRILNFLLGPELLMLRTVERKKVIVFLPEAVYDARYTKPTTGELDNECLAKDKAKNCNKS